MRAVWSDEELGRIRFRCPGCECSHVITVKGNAPWGWNGSFELPTFAPSVLTMGHEWVLDDPSAEPIWEDVPGMPGAKRDARPGHFIEVRRCHSFVTDGRIQFLSDCAHELAGQTVDLPELD